MINLEAIEHDCNPSVAALRLYSHRRNDHSHRAGIHHSHRRNTQCHQICHRCKFPKEMSGALCGQVVCSSEGATAAHIYFLDGLHMTSHAPMARTTPDPHKAPLATEAAPTTRRQTRQAGLSSQQAQGCFPVAEGLSVVVHRHYQIPLSCGPSVRPPLVPSAGRVPSARVHRAGTASPERHNRAPRDFRGG